MQAEKGNEERVGGRRGNGGRGGEANAPRSGRWEVWDREDVSTSQSAV